MSSTIQAAAVSKGDAEAVWLRAIGVPEHDPFTRDCSFLRAILWALARGGRRQAHILRILNVAVDIACETTGSDERAVRAALRNALDEIADAGDAVEVGDGWWLPAATREVQLHDGNDLRLLVGGVPTALLSPGLQAAVEAHGPFRRTRSDALRLELGLATETLESWAGAPRTPMQAWASQLLDSPLTKYSEPNEGTRLRFYAPDRARPGAAQGARWAERPDGAGRFLMERTRIFGAREYRIAELREGRVESSGGTLLPGEHRRLMYALDARAKNPVSVRMMQTGDSVTLTLWSEVPRAEQRLFAALGHLELEDGRYYPRAWRFHLVHRGLVEAGLHGLGVVVQSDLRRGQ